MQSVLLPQFSPSLIQHLSDLPTSGGDNSPSSERQSTLDEHVRRRISAELARLKAEEAEVQEKIQRALEKENLESETSANDKVKSSQALQQELDQIAKKVEVHREKRDLQRNYPDVASKRDDLVRCYRKNREKPLECWFETAEFRNAVREAEQVRYLL